MTNIEIAPGFRMIRHRSKKGRPPIPMDHILKAMSLLDAHYTYQQVADMTGIGKSTIGRYRKQYNRPRIIEESQDALYDIGVVAI